MNTMGTERWEDRRGTRGRLVVGRRKRFRLVLRLVKVSRGEQIGGQTDEEAAREADKARRSPLLASIKAGIRKVS